MLEILYPYPNITETLIGDHTEMYVSEHLSGFDQNYSSEILEKLDTFAQEKGRVLTVYSACIVKDEIKKQYPNLNILLIHHELHELLKPLHDYRNPPNINYKNFLCTFNGSPHLGRQLLTAYLYKQDLFNPEYCSKNFEINDNMIWNELEFQTDNAEYYYNFFKNQNDFYETIYSFGWNRFQHGKNIYTLQDKLAGSFLHLVSETCATSAVPYITEKFLYSIVTKGLYIAHAPMDWHNQVHTLLGFKPYSIFDYDFDSIKNPITRLIKLMEQVQKFSKLSVSDWNDIRQMEIDSIEYNYHHYFSKEYIKYIDRIGT